MAPPRTADEVRAAWRDFFAARGHTVVPSASVIPVDDSVLFTVAGMVPFKPYFVGDVPAPYPRAVSVQKCVRAGGKHNDLDDIGRTNRHFSFFEMLGNFSFGDYFKRDAICWAWEFVRDVLELPTDPLWVTVHTSDDEAEALWLEHSDIPAERIQRLGDDNYWRMGDTGPCGPSSEIFYDLGEEFGADGGPAHGGEDRFIEFWNLVFMQFDARPDGTEVELPRPSIDTGAGLERLLAILQGCASIWDIDVFVPLIEKAAALSGSTYGRDDEIDVSLRILAEHARTMAVMISDGVVPSNEERGYVLRRIIRRAVRHGYRTGARSEIMTPIVNAAIDSLAAAYPQLEADRTRVLEVVEREESRFLSTLQRGLEMLDGLLVDGDLDGDDAFFLHDTLGFPVDLTREIAAERGREVDLDGFLANMKSQRERAKSAQREGSNAAAVEGVEVFRGLIDSHGPTEFTGRSETRSQARVLALLVNGERVDSVQQGTVADVVLDRTPFYAESGGQVGDTGTLHSASGARADVLDTVYGLAGVLHSHRIRVTEGALLEGDAATAEIDCERRDAIRRHHTATHLLHAALRQVLGESVRQAGSYVGPDRLRFDFSHHEGAARAELDLIEDMVNAQVLTDAPVRHFETTKDEALAAGALAFFGEKYGDVVRVLEAGDHSTELCGGTHVPALGFIGPVRIMSEGSIGSNLRRIEAVAGEAALETIRSDERTLRTLADMLRASPAEVETKVERILEQIQSMQNEIEKLQARAAVSEASDLAATARDGIVVAQRDGLAPDALGKLVEATVGLLQSGIVAVAGTAPGGEKAGIAVAVTPDLVERGVSAAEVAETAARALGGGTAKNPKLVVGGGPDVGSLDEALVLLAEAASAAT